KVVLQSLFEYSVAAESNIEESCDGAGVFIGDRQLRENSPAVVLRPLDQELTAHVADRKRSAFRLNRIERWSGNNNLFDCVEGRVTLCRYGVAEGVLAGFSEPL